MQIYRDSPASTAQGDKLHSNTNPDSPVLKAALPVKGSQYHPSHYLCLWEENKKSLKPSSSLSLFPVLMEKTSQRHE